jgi:menaquinone-dependent protoporphyrinogen oxidase
MSRILVLYGSTYGQTQRIAKRIGRLLSAAGHTVDVLWGRRLPPSFRLDDYGGVVIAASVLMGRHQPYITEFVRGNADRLNAMPSAFVSVCGAAGEDPPRAQSYVDRFLSKTGWWRPTVTRSFTGAVVYTKYGRLLRWWMKLISRRQGLPTDTSRDWDLTEWNEVERFARELAVRLAPAPAEAVLRGASTG